MRAESAARMRAASIATMINWASIRAWRSIQSSRSGRACSAAGSAPPADPHKIKTAAMHITRRSAPVERLEARQTAGVRRHRGITFCPASPVCPLRWCVGQFVFILYRKGGAAGNWYRNDRQRGRRAARADGRTLHGDPRRDAGAGAGVRAAAVALTTCVGLRTGLAGLVDG